MVVKKRIFRLYENKTSIKKRHSRYSQGGDIDVFINRLGWWEPYDLTENQNDDIFIPSLPKVYAFRPDLLANDVYGKSGYDWVILQYNNIVDIQEEFITGATLILPSKSRVNIDIMANVSRNLDVDP